MASTTKWTTCRLGFEGVLLFFGFRSLIDRNPPDNSQPKTRKTRSWTVNTENTNFVVSFALFFLSFIKQVIKLRPLSYFFSFINLMTSRIYPFELAFRFLKLYLTLALISCSCLCLLVEKILIYPWFGCFIVCAITGS